MEIVLVKQGLRIFCGVIISLCLYSKPRGYNLQLGSKISGDGNPMSM